MLSIGQFVRFAAVLTLPLLTAETFAQGSLTPPGPPSPTMKTLAQIEPRTPIGSLPFVIRASGAYYLTTNVTGIAGAHGITVDASDVTIDLEGFALTGVPNTLNGIVLSPGRGNVTIRNGTISHWSYGVDARASSQVRCESLRASENVVNGISVGLFSMIVNCTAVANQGVGISSDSDSLITDSIARSNASHGIVAGAGNKIAGCTSSSNQGIGLSSGGSCLVSSCITDNNGASGIAAGTDAQISNCKASGNGSYGISAGGDAAINACTAASNLDAGIIVGGGSHVIDSKSTANAKGIVAQASSTVRGCSTLQNSGDGIRVTKDCVVSGNTSKGNFLARDAAGIRATETGNTIQDNTLTANDWGLRVDVARNMIIRNTASNNSLNYSIGATPQSMGPVVSGDRFTDNTNPLANIEF